MHKWIINIQILFLFVVLHLWVLFYRNFMSAIVSALWILIILDRKKKKIIFLTGVSWSFMNLINSVPNFKTKKNRKKIQKITLKSMSFWNCLQSYGKHAWNYKSFSGFTSIALPIRYGSKSHSFTHFIKFTWQFSLFSLTVFV